MAYSITTNAFDFFIKNARGQDFCYLPDIEAEITLDKFGELDSVDAIFTLYDKERIYLDETHPLYAEIVSHVYENEQDLIPEDWKEQFDPCNLDRDEDNA